MPRASLPMYNLPEMRDANANFWHALAEVLRDDGVRDVPAELSTSAAVPERIEGDVLFTQTCGFPLQTIYSGQYRLLAVPTYEAPGCHEGTHCAFVVSRRDGPSQVTDLRGERFAVNSLHSNSGMNLPRMLFAQQARGAPYFSETVMTGSHGASLAAVRSGKVAGASVDCLTWAFTDRYSPALVEGLRVIAQTPPSPSIPFVTSSATPPETVAILKRCLGRLFGEPAFAAVRAPLFLVRISEPDPAAYARIMDYETVAATLGYPDLV